MRKKIIKRSIISLLLVFIVMNVVAYMHAYKFTHFEANAADKNIRVEHLSFWSKCKMLFTGLPLAKPFNSKVPTVAYKTIYIGDEQKIEGWWINHSKNKGSYTKGTIIIFHGYLGTKSSLLDRVPIFDSLGYNCLLIDFAGAGGSEGNTCTIGYHEAVQVKAAYDYVAQQGAQNIYLYGVSMGAVAIMKALHDNDIPSKALLLECPFGTMYQTVEARFKTMGMPVFPMADLLVFWGGVQNDFNAFQHNPIDYARSIQVPTLLMYGAKDATVSIAETNEIFKNLPNQKTLKIFDNAGHENYLKLYKENWIQTVSLFLSQN